MGREPLLCNGRTAEAAVAGGAAGLPEVGHARLRAEDGRVANRLQVLRPGRQAQRVGQHVLVARHAAACAQPPALVEQGPYG